VRSAGVTDKKIIMKVISERMVNNRTLRLVQGDITERNVDAIVNAANSNLQHGGGVASAIVRKGGQIIQQESNKIGHVSVGSSAVTGAGELPCKVVIHTVGPRMGEGNEDAKLKSAINSALKTAIQQGYKSISIPAISAGIFGFPKDRCAEILMSESRKVLASDQQFSLETVEFCIFDDETLGYFNKAFEKIS
jgi:O-acetyl-ADP-ribose deacetylase